MLKEHYLSQGRPDRRKHVFGKQRDRRDVEGEVGGRLSRCSSYRRRLRRHLRLAGVTRYELHNDVDADADGTGGSRRADFHSFRRLFCTSFAAANVNINIQQAMELAGHRRAETAMRYVQLAQKVMTAPAASRPKRAVRADTGLGPKPPADTADTASRAGS